MRRLLQRFSSKSLTLLDGIRDWETGDPEALRRASLECLRRKSRNEVFTQSALALSSKARVGVAGSSVEGRAAHYKGVYGAGVIQFLGFAAASSAARLAMQSTAVAEWDGARSSEGVNGPRYYFANLILRRAMQTCARQLLGCARYLVATPSKEANGLQL